MIMSLVRPFLSKALILLAASLGSYFFAHYQARETINDWKKSYDLLDNAYSECGSYRSGSAADGLRAGNF